MSYNGFMKKKIIIFDLDGTLLNTLEDLTDSTNFALKSCGYSTKTLDEVKNFVGNGVYKLIERAIGENLSAKDVTNCLEIFKKKYSQNMYNKTSPYDGIINMLKILKIKGYKIAVVSNKFDKAVKELCNKYFPNLIDFSTGENEEKGIRKKPAPDSIIAVIKQYNLTLKDAIYIGDSEVDIQTARNAHIPCISVTWGFKDREFLIQNGAEYLIDSPDEIIEILKSL